MAKARPKVRWCASCCAYWHARRARQWCRVCHELLIDRELPPVPPEIRPGIRAEWDPAVPGSIVFNRTGRRAALARDR